MFNSTRRVELSFASLPPTFVCSMSQEYTASLPATLNLLPSTQPLRQFVIPSKGSPCFTYLQQSPMSKIRNKQTTCSFSPSRRVQSPRLTMTRTASGPTTSCPPRDGVGVTGGRTAPDPGQRSSGVLVVVSPEGQG